jgi:transposase
MCVRGWRSSPVMKSSSRSRARPVGASLSRRSSAPGIVRIWPTRRRRRPSGAASGAAKTDNADCDLQLRLLLADELPESWIPPAHILELRARVRMRKTLLDQRTAWLQRVQAQLFQQGVPAGLRLRSEVGRQALAAADLSPAGRELVELGLRMIDALDRELVPLTRELGAFARRQAGCRALIASLYGVGPVSATAILAELGDARRFSSSDDAVRHAGLDVTVHQSGRSITSWSAQRKTR